ncbi:MAG: DEAD/DEAH box helicase [Hyphomicrobiaceae bacterium]
MNTFSDLGLAAPVLKALDREGYDKPTPIQSQAIPPAIAGRDILGIAQTGTGKTAAFALPLIHRLATNRQSPPRKGARVLVLSPTRELAAQIAASCTAYAGSLQLSITAVYGGVGHGSQIRKLARGVDILVATPGRLLDHLSSGSIKLNQTEVLVLDEADQMLDLGFVKPIRQIVSRLPRDRQTLFFSATMPASIAELARDFLRDAKRVSASPVSSTVERVSQRVIHLNFNDKRAAVARLIVDQRMERTLVFTRTKRGADRVAKHLDIEGIRVAAIHGNKSQSQRERALGAFRSDKIQVLVATDIAARGIDIDGVSHVINYELPEVPEAYVHRIGRTARAGASGCAISLCDRSEIKYLRGIERLIRQKIPHETRCQDENHDERPAEVVDRARSVSRSKTDTAAREDSAKLRGKSGKAHHGKSRSKSRKPSTRRKGARRAKPVRSDGNQAAVVRA